LLAAPLVLGCAPRAAKEVVVYTALDEEFAKIIFEDFTRDTGIAVRAAYDVESTKSVQLTERILAERGRPRCDVFWNNEIINTLRLDREGLLAKYDSPAGRAYPPQYRSANGTWYGFAARARVLVVNTNLVSEAERPTSIRDMADPKWKGRAGIAKPLAGTTATHAACLFAACGDEPAKEFFRAVKQNARIMGGNKQVARAVADGELAFGLTDTDDAIIEIESGRPVAIVFPDQHGDAKGVGSLLRLETSSLKGSNQSQKTPDPVGPQPLGTLIIPNTLGIIRGAEHRAEAERLVEYLLSPTVEERLAKGPSAQFPLNPKTAETSRAAPTEPIREMAVDFTAAAEKWDAAAKFLRDEFATAE
jgi:iron(III) transport system substrate-binding protein